MKNCLKRIIGFSSICCIMICSLIPTPVKAEGEDLAAQVEAAKNAYEAWVKTNMIAYYGSTIKFDDISGDGIPELLIYTSGDDTIATYRDGNVVIVESAKNDYTNKDEFSELLYNPTNHTITVHKNRFKLKKWSQVLEGDFWIETSYDAKMKTKKVLRTVINDGSRYVVKNGTYGSKKVISRTKKALYAEVKRLKKGLPIYNTDNGGITYYSGHCSTVNEFYIKDNLLYVYFRQDVPVYNYNTPGDALSYTSCVIAPLSEDCQWTHSNVGIPEIYYESDDNYQNIKKTISNIHDSALRGEGGEMGLQIFVKDGKIIHVRTVES